jgi:hypothetical protein
MVLVDAKVCIVITDFIFYFSFIDYFSLCIPRLGNFKRCWLIGQRCSSLVATAGVIFALGLFADFVLFFIYLFIYLYFGVLSLFFLLLILLPFCVCFLS